MESYVKSVEDLAIALLPPLTDQALKGNISIDRMNDKGISPYTMVNACVGAVIKEVQELLQ